MLILGDCLIELKKIASDSVDIIFTSPPYNLGNKHHTEKKYHQPYEDNLPEDIYQNWQKEILKECFRILKKEGSLIYNHKNRIKKGIQITPYAWLLQTPFLIKQEWIWLNGSPNFDKIRFYPQTERIYWLVKDEHTQLNNIISHNDLFKWSPEGTLKKHTRSFPEKMVFDILSCFPDSKIVLDPFMGSGTVGVVCQYMKKDFIGIEIKEEYYNLAQERINNAPNLLF